MHDGKLMLVDEKTMIVSSVNKLQLRQIIWNFKIFSMLELLTLKSMSILFFIILYIRVLVFWPSKLFYELHYKVDVMPTDL